MKKLNKISLKQSGGEYTEQQRIAEQQAAQQQQAEQQAAQQQQQDPVMQLATSFSKMVDDGYDPKEVIMQFVESEIPEELILNTLLKVGYEEEDIKSLFTDIANTSQKDSAQQQAQQQPVNNLESNQYLMDLTDMPAAKTGGDLPIARDGNQPIVDRDEGYVKPLPNYAQQRANMQALIQRIYPSYNNRTTLLGKGAYFFDKLGDMVQPKYDFSHGFNPFSKKDMDGDGFADGWFRDSAAKNKLKKNLRQRDRKLRQLQGTTIKIDENDPNTYTFDSQGNFITTDQYNKNVAQHSTAQHITPQPNRYKGYAYDSDPTPYMTPKQKADYLKHKKTYGTVEDQRQHLQKNNNQLINWMDFLGKWKQGGFLPSYQKDGEIKKTNTLPTGDTYGDKFDEHFPHFRDNSITFPRPRHPRLMESDTNVVRTKDGRLLYPKYATPHIPREYHPSFGWGYYTGQESKIPYYYEGENPDDINLWRKFLGETSLSHGLMDIEEYEKYSPVGLKSKKQGGESYLPKAQVGIPGFNPAGLDILMQEAAPYIQYEQHFIKEKEKNPYYWHKYLDKINREAPKGSKNFREIKDWKKRGDNQSFPYDLREYMLKEAQKKKQDILGRPDLDLYSPEELEEYERDKFEDKRGKELQYLIEEMKWNQGGWRKRWPDAKPTETESEYYKRRCDEAGCEKPVMNYGGESYPPKYQAAGEWPSASLAPMSFEDWYKSKGVGLMGKSSQEVNALYEQETGNTIDVSKPVLDLSGIQGTTDVRDAYADWKVPSDIFQQYPIDAKGTMFGNLEQSSDFYGPIDEEPEPEIDQVSPEYQSMIDETEAGMIRPSSKDFIDYSGDDDITVPKSFNLDELNKFKDGTVDGMYGKDILMSQQSNTSGFNNIDDSKDYNAPIITKKGKGKQGWNKMVNTFGDVSELAVAGADFLNEAFKKRAERKAEEDLYRMTMADNAFGVYQNRLGSRGYWDVNTGLLEQDQKTPIGYGMAKKGRETYKNTSKSEGGFKNFIKEYQEGGDFYNAYMPFDMYGNQNAFDTFVTPEYQYGGQMSNEVEVSDEMIQKLIAAGADIEYL